MFTNTLRKWIEERQNYYNNITRTGLKTKETEEQMKKNMKE